MPNLFRVLIYSENIADLLKVQCVYSVHNAAVFHSTKCYYPVANCQFWPFSGFYFCFTRLNSEGT